jgi:hypothetical protein
VLYTATPTPNWKQNKQNKNTIASLHNTEQKKNKIKQTHIFILNQNTGARFLAWCSPGNDAPALVPVLFFLKGIADKQKQKITF